MPSENTYWFSLKPGLFDDQKQFIEKERFKLADHIYNIPPPKPQLKLDLWSKFTHSDISKPFTFELGPLNSGGDKWIDNNGRSLICLDKFGWMGLNIYSTHIFGLGERVKTSFGFPDKGNFTGWAWGQDSVVDMGIGGN